MRKHFAFTIIFLGSLILGCTAKETEEQLQFTTNDNVRLNGQIDFPSDSFKAVVLLVQGTGLFDRDVEFGNSNTEKDLIFKEISKTLTSNGFAVTRFDYRGVKCNKRNMPSCPNCLSSKEQFSHFVRQCIDNDIRATVTPENIRNDIEIFYKHIASHPKFLNKKIIVFGHSEGSLNLAHLIAKKRIDPHGIVFMGGLAESPQSLIHWQLTERMIHSFLEFDFDSNGLIDNEEIKLGHTKKLNILHYIPLTELFSPKGFWTKTTIKAELENTYLKIKNEALNLNDLEPYGTPELIQASNRWWKMFFNDGLSTAEQLINYKRKIVYLNGENDSQTNFNRQIDEINRLSESFIVKPEINIVDNTGHSLGLDPILGPLLPSSINLIIDTCNKLLQE